MKFFLVLLLIFFSSGVFATQDSVSIKSYLQGRDITLVYHDRQGHIWLATSGNDLFRFDGKTLTEYSLPEIAQILNLSHDVNGDVLIATSKGLFRKKGDELESYITEVSSEKSINDFIPYDRNIQYIASNNKIWKILSGQASEIDINHTQAIKKIEKINDQFYAISDNYLIQFNGKGKFIKYPTETPISDICIYDDQKIMLAMGNKGLGVYDDGIIKTFAITDLPKSLNIISLQSFEHYLLIGTSENGLWIWDEKDYSLAQLSDVNGILSDEINAIEVDHWGYCWLAATNGLHRIRIEKMLRQNPPIVTIEEIQSYPSQRDTSTINRALQFRADYNYLNIRFNAVDLSSDEPIEIQWRLSEQDIWSTPINIREINLSKLKAGNYEFQLRASSNQKYFGYSEKIILQAVLPFYKSVWFFGFLGLGILLISWTISWLRLRSLQKKFQSSREKWKMQKQLFEVEQKALQQQMNPHFVFNALQSIKGLVSINQNSAARRYLNSFAQLLRSVLKQSREGSISLDNEINYLEDYLKLEQLNRNQNFYYSIHADKLDLDITIPAMIIQPFVENAIIHGLKNRPGKIEVYFEDKQNWLKVTVNDDGVGMSDSIRKEHSLGTQIVRDRLSHYSSAKKQFTFSYTVLDESNKNNQGTSVSIQIPILG